MLDQSRKPGKDVRISWKLDFNQTLGCSLQAEEYSIRKLRVRKLPDIFQEWGANMLELVGMKRVDKGGKIAQESHQHPNCLLRDFCARECHGPSHVERVYPIYSVRKG